MSNWIRRHWDGDLSLGLSYWVNGILAGAVVNLLANLVPTETPPIANLGLVLLVIIGAVWSSVGIWRSAGNNIRRGGSKFWSYAACTTIVIGAVYSAITLAFIGTVLIATFRQGMTQ